MPKIWTINCLKRFYESDIQLIVTPSDISGIVEYQPGYNRFFINEELGLPIGSYIDYIHEKSNKLFHIISNADVMKSRIKIHPHKPIRLQTSNRKAGNALVSIDIPNFNSYIDLPDSKIIKEKVRYPNHKHTFTACLSVFHYKINGKWEPTTRRGITIDLNSLKVNKDNF
jgi:hypothetical protein